MCCGYEEQQKRTNGLCSTYHWTCWLNWISSIDSVRCKVKRPLLCRDNVTVRNNQNGHRVAFTQTKIYLEKKSSEPIPAARSPTPVEMFILVCCSLHLCHSFSFRGVTKEMWRVMWSGYKLWDDQMCATWFVVLDSSLLAHFKLDRRWRTETSLCQLSAVGLHSIWCEVRTNLFIYHLGGGKHLKRPSCFPRSYISCHFL